MARPIFYHGNYLLSGTVTGSNDSAANPVRKVHDGSINLPYVFSVDVDPTTQSGQVTVDLTTRELPAALSLPKCALLSGHTVKLQSMTNTAGDGTVDVITSGLTAPQNFLLAELPVASGNFVWRVVISGASGLVTPKVNEVQLASTKTQLPRSPEVAVSREHVRQFTRMPVPGGQPFVKRDGPMLRLVRYQFRSVQGTETNALRSFVQDIEGGSAFTMTSDLEESYWAELLAPTVPEEDEAGVSQWTLTPQEIKVD